MIENLQQQKWSVEEDTIVMDHYPTGGWKAVQALLPHRTRQAIFRHAVRVGAAKKRAEPSEWPLPSPADLTEQLLNLHLKRAYGATPGQLIGRV